jgi:ATP-dependent RNA helicase DDX24/MAK5
MAPMVGPESHVNENLRHKSKKRKRNTDEQPRMVQVKNQKLGAVGDVSADALHWKEVALPDRLDDAEGFFGLEEIEGVEVLRPQGAAKPPRFKVRPKFVGSGLS